MDQCPDWQMSVTSFLLLATHRCNEILAGTAKQSLLRGTAGQAKSTPYFTYSVSLGHMLLACLPACLPALTCNACKLQKEKKKTEA